jgi:predicted DNA-binding transcriptional regulator YafY
MEILMTSAERIIKILKLFSSKTYLNVSDIQNHLRNEGYELHKKSIQRDLNILKDCELIYSTGNGNQEREWRHVKLGGTSLPVLNIQNNELISFYLLKAYLRKFKGTVIEEGIVELERKLDIKAPGEVFSVDSLLWDKNIGRYDYTNEDWKIRRLIKFITENQWVEIAYERSASGEVNQFKCLPKTMLEYKGSLYAVVFTTGRRDEHRALLVQNILSIEPCESVTNKVLELDFNLWSKERFGVYHGNPESVKLLIKKEYRKYFENRSWHSSQKFSSDKEGNLIIKLKVALMPDFISWLMSWGEAVVVLEPNKLKYRIKDKLEAALRNY